VSLSKTLNPSCSRGV